MQHVLEDRLRFREAPLFTPQGTDPRARQDRLVMLPAEPGLHVFHGGKQQAFRFLIASLRGHQAAQRVLRLVGQEVLLADAFHEIGEQRALHRLGVWVGRLRRVEGLFALNSRDYAKAQAALADALQIQELRHGRDHWRTKRAREDLARVPGV